ncbi:MAG: DUF2878 domain-containing protein [Rubrivivax sp.]
MTGGDDRGRTLRIAVNLVAYQAAWFACVLGAARGINSLGVAAVVAALALHLALSRHRASDALLIVATLATGLVWEAALAQTGLVEYAAHGPSALWALWAPAWILALWALFAAVLREPLRWLHGRPLLGALLGGVGGALSYQGAARLGACNFADPVAALLVLGIGWAVITPLLIELARRLDPRPQTQPQPQPQPVACS